MWNLARGFLQDETLLRNRQVDSPAINFVREAIVVAVGVIPEEG